MVSLLQLRQVRGCLAPKESVGFQNTHNVFWSKTTSHSHRGLCWHRLCWSGWSVTVGVSGGGLGSVCLVILTCTIVHSEDLKENKLCDLCLWWNLSCLHSTGSHRFRPSVCQGDIHALQLSYAVIFLSWSVWNRVKRPFCYLLLI